MILPIFWDNEWSHGMRRHLVGIHILLAFTRNNLTQKKETEAIHVALMDGLSSIVSLR